MSDMHVCGTCGGAEDCRPGCSCAGCVGAARDKARSDANARSQLAATQAELDRARAALERITVTVRFKGLGFDVCRWCQKTECADGCPTNIARAFLASTPTPNGTPGMDMVERVLAVECPVHFAAGVGCPCDVQVIMNGPNRPTVCYARIARALATPPIPEKERNSGSLPSHPCPAEAEGKCDGRCRSLGCWEPCALSSPSHTGACNCGRH